MGIPADLPNIRHDKGPILSKFVQLIEWCRSRQPKPGRGILVSITPGGAVISTTAAEAVRIAKANENISAPTWDGTDLTADNGSITFLKPSGTGWTLGTENATAWNVQDGGGAVTSGDLLIVSWCDGRWAIHFSSC